MGALLIDLVRFIQWEADGALLETRLGVGNMIKKYGLVSTLDEAELEAPVLDSKSEIFSKWEDIVKQANVIPVDPSPEEVPAEDVPAEEEEEDDDDELELEENVMTQDQAALKLQMAARKRTAVSVLKGLRA